MKCSSVKVGALNKSPTTGIATFISDRCAWCATTFGIINADVMWSNIGLAVGWHHFEGCFVFSCCFLHLLVSGPLWSFGLFSLVLIAGHNQKKNDKQAGFCTGRQRVPEHELAFLHEFLNGLLWFALCWCLCLCCLCCCLYFLSCCCSSSVGSSSQSSSSS